MCLIGYMMYGLLFEQIKKENEMKANGTYYITGNDPLIGVLGKEHGGRTRSASSTQGSKKVLGTNKGEMMQKVSMKDLESMAGKILADVKPEMDQLRADIATLKKVSNGMSSGVSGHITVDKFDEIEVILYLYKFIVYNISCMLTYV